MLARVKATKAEVLSFSELCPFVHAHGIEFGAFYCRVRLGATETNGASCWNAEAFLRAKTMGLPLFALQVPLIIGTCC